MCTLGLITLPKNGGVETHFGSVETQKKVETHFGVSTPPQTGIETQNKGLSTPVPKRKISQHACAHRENEHKTGVAYAKKTINEMLAQFTGRSTVSCALWRCLQHDSTMTLLTLNTRTR